VNPPLDGLPIGRRRVVVALVAITSVLSVLDSTISNVALPSIARDLHVTSADVVWVVNAFQLATTMLLLPLSALGDIVGFRRVYLSGVAIFTAASILCALSHSLPALVASRFVQGIGAAAILSSGQPISRFAYPARMLGVAVGIQTLVISISGAAGPSIGGFILGVGSWPWMFWINLPFGILCLAFGGLLPLTPRQPHRFDWASAVMSGTTLVLLITGIDQLRIAGHLAFSIAELSAAVVLGTLLVRRQPTLDTPIFAIDLLRIRIVSLSLISAFIVFISQNAMMIALPFYFQALGNDPTQTGILLTPFALGSALIATIAGYLSDRYHPGLLGVVGLSGYVVSLILLATLPHGASTFAIIWRVLLGGVGYGLFISPNIRAIIGNVPRSRSGAITGLVTSNRMIAATCGVAFAALIFSFGGSTEPGHVGIGTIRIVLDASAALAIVAIGTSALRIESSGARTEALMDP
jgi:DHA2 family multidrug resistance protein-like MFS transporter